MKVPVYIVDAFTDQAFKGNPAGVCLIDDAIEDELMQSIASELNLSETAFLTPDKNHNNTFSIQYFTPTVEIAFCGHATLASAKIILDKFNKQEVTFNTKAGLQLSTAKSDSGIIMKFPVYNTTPYTPVPSLYDAIGIKSYNNTRYAEELSMLIIEITDLNTLKNLKPDFGRMLATATPIKEVVVTTRSEDSEYDFYSRCFCPWIGINEDPVTGAAHSVLSKYWSEKLNKKEMKAFQASKRGGYMKLRMINEDTVEVISNAQIIIEGILLVK